MMDIDYGPQPGPDDLRMYNDFEVETMARDAAEGSHLKAALNEVVLLRQKLRHRGVGLRVASGQEPPKAKHE